MASKNTRERSNDVFACTALLLAFVFVGCGGAPSDDRRGGRILYDIDGNIESMRIEGTFGSKIFTSTSADVEPSSVFNTKVIAFNSDRDGDEEIYIHDLNTGTLTQLTKNNADDRDPEWNSIGTKIVFGSSRDGNREIYIMNSDGSDQRRLTNSPGSDDDPFFVDDNRIVFESNRDGDNEIYMMNVDGLSIPVKLTDNNTEDSNPKRSQDGRILFQSDRLSPGTNKIFAMEFDGTEPKQITFGPGDDREPVADTTDDYVVFVSNRHGNDELYMISGDDLGDPEAPMTRLTNTPGNEGNPSYVFY